jgi:hypothetical protein
MRTQIGCALVMLLMSAAFAEQPQMPTKQEKHTWRTVGTVAGSVGGYVLGLGIGLAKYDDAVYGTRKVWTMAIACAVGGGVGGYFAGRAIDKHNAFTWRLDPMDRSLLHAQQASMGCAEAGSITP